MDLFGEGLAWLANPANWTDPRNGILLRLWEHLSLSAVALALAVAIGLPLGLWIGHTGRGAGVVIAIANVGRAVPSVGWLGLVFPITLVILGRGGLGFIPAVIALTLLGIPPIVTNTFAGMREVDRDLIEAGRGMGMTAGQVVWRVEVPVSLPVILAGVRVSAVQIVATATLATIVGGGTLGAFIIQGIDVRALERVVGAAVLVSLLAIGTEVLFSLIERVVVSPGIRARATSERDDAAQLLPSGAVPSGD